jgi:hypothetical protein
MKLDHNKSILLTSPKIRKDPELQNGMANVMKEMTVPQARELTNKVKSGEVKKEGKNQEEMAG